MDLGGDLSWIGICLKIFFIDVLLGGDNAIVIALACRGLPARMVPKAVALGAVGAIFFRVVIAALAGTLLILPTLKIVAGGLLLMIAINLLAGEYQRSKETGEEALALESSIVEGNGYFGAAFVIFVVDAIMSLDNVVALASVSEGDYFYLIGGLLFSVPFLFYGSLIVSEAMKHFPALIMVGAALLGWVGGELIVSDPIWADWIRSNAEALIFFFPVVSAVFVIAEAKITAAARDAEVSRRLRTAPARGAAPRPKPVPRAVRPVPASGSSSSSTAVAAMVASSPISTIVSSAVETDPALEAKNERIVLIGLIGMTVVVSIIFLIALYLSSQVG